MIRWALKWRSNNKLDGKQEHFIATNGSYLLFPAKKWALAHIEGNYKYIAKRKDLRSEPHGWRMPIPVRVKVTLTEITHSKGGQS